MFSLANEVLVVEADAGNEEVLLGEHALLLLRHRVVVRHLRVPDHPREAGPAHRRDLRCGAFDHLGVPAYNYIKNKLKSLDRKESTANMT